MLYCFCIWALFYTTGCEYNMNIWTAFDITEQWSKRYFGTLAFIRTVLSLIKVVLAKQN